MIKYLSRLKIVEEAYTAKVFPGLNAVKGILIMLVIYTHSLPNGMLLYFNYFFHMPVFLAVSGYLLKRSAFKFGIFHYLQRLFHRLIIPWLIATVCYFPFSFRLRHLAHWCIDLFYGNQAKDTSYYYFDSYGCVYDCLVRYLPKYLSCCRTAAFVYFGREKILLISSIFLFRFCFTEWTHSDKTTSFVARYCGYGGFCCQCNFGI